MTKECDVIEYDKYHEMIKNEKYLTFREEKIVLQGWGKILLLRWHWEMAFKEKKVFQDMKGQKWGGNQLQALGTA